MSLFVLVLLALAPQGSQRAEHLLKSFPFEYPAPEGWKTELQPLPPDVVSPEVRFPWRGDLIIRFAPGFVQAGAPGFFTTTYLWWVNGDKTGDREGFERELREALLKNERGFVGTYLLRRQPNRDISSIAVDVSFEGNGEKLGHRQWSYKGTIRSFDPFVSLREMDFGVELHAWYCEVHGHTAIFFMRSPALHEQAGSLRGQFRAFQCH